MVPPPDLRGRLRAALDPAPTPHPARGDRLAAVLAPLIEKPEPALVFTVRASGLSRHAGEVSFPGGLQDPGEALVETALREAFEEIGLAKRDVEILGALPPVHTSVSGILVIPFVGMLEAPPGFTLSDDEIAEVLTVSVTQLAAVEREVEHRFEDAGTWRGWAYDVERHTVWGATGRMLHSLLEAIRKETPWLSREP
jgi:8-oxo-dGTP pyrophosphatase MutT (NUDIX family)